MAHHLGYVAILALVWVSMPVDAASNAANMSLVQLADFTWNTLLNIHKDVWGDQDPSSEFYDAALEITKSVAQAHASAQRSPDAAVDVRDLSKYIKLATDKKNIPYARSVLARTLYGFFKLYLKTPGKLPLKIEAISFAASTFLETLKDDIGPKVFDSLVARRGGKTLAFAVDTTGSMTDDIKAAKAIAKAIVQESRRDKVDYILSPFGDPSYGPIIYKSEEEGQGFVEALDAISPRGGGDCKELTYAGILEALNSGPQYGSPLFVITDASAKDDTETNIKTAKVIAQSTGITINFFTKYSGCDHTGVEKFRDLASFTGGQVFPLKSDQELKNLTNFVRDSLETTQILSMSRSYDDKRRSSRSVQEHRYPLDVDDFVVKLRVAVTTEKNSRGLVSLVDPNGGIEPPSTALDRSILYSIKNPKPGRWTLVVPKAVGKFDYVARVKSTKIIKFGFYFVLIHNGISSPISYPVVDEKCTVYVTIGGAIHTDISSLALRLVNLKGHTLQKGIKLMPLGSTGVHFKAVFIPPGKSTFKIVLQGSTKRGIKFTRVSRQEITAKGLLFLALYGQGDFTAKPGHRMMLVVGLHNSEGTEFFKLKAFSGYGKVKILRNRIIARKGRMGFSTLVFTPKSTSKHGSAISLFVIARGEKSARIIREVIRLIVIRPERLE